MRVIRFDKIQIRRDEMKRREGDGALVIPGKFARTGLQSYEQGDGSVRVELRSDAEVSRSAPLFKGVTITDEHPATEMINPRNWRLHARGHVEDPVFEDGWISGNFVVTDADLASKIEAGDRAELSAGYYADFVEQPGTIDGAAYDGEQANILPNHVATLSEGQARAGREARLRIDSTGNQIRPGHVADSDDHRDREEDRMNDIEITVGGITYEVKADSAAAQALRKELGRVRTLETDLEKAQAKADATEEELAKLKEEEDQDEEEETEPDEEKVDALVQARVKVITDAQRIAGPRIDTKGKPRDLKIRALNAIGIKGLEEKTDAYVDARFDIELERSATPAAGPTLGDLAEQATPPSRTDQGNPSDPFAILEESLGGYCDHAMGRGKENN